MMTDPIADMLTRMRNATAVNKPEVLIPYSKLKAEIAKILQSSGYISGAEKEEEGHPQLKVSLKYKGKLSVIRGLKRVSKPGRRVYASKDDLPIVLNNIGIAVISTSKGLMTNKEAKRHGLGGEIIFEVY